LRSIFIFFKPKSVFAIPLALLFLCGICQSQPCQDFTCDTLAVRAILDTNGFDTVSIYEVVSMQDILGRITSLEFRDRPSGGWPFPRAGLPSKLTILPSQIGNLSSLNSLDIGWNQLTRIPKEIGNLTSLSSLKLVANQLKSIPSEIGNLTALIDLDLGGNQLTNITEKIGNLSLLKSLSLSDNKLYGLPPEIGNLSSLKSLYLGDNNLATLPPEIGNLKSLKQLYLGFNTLTKLPPEIGKLCSLTVLKLRGNQLTNLPAEIGNLDSLNELDLHHNRLTSLPSEVLKLKTLSILYVAFNSLCEISYSVFQWIDEKSTNSPNFEQWQTMQYSDFVNNIECNVTIGIKSNLLSSQNKSNFAIFPNPFNHYTSIRFSIPNSFNQTISIFNPQGHLINTLQSGSKTTGNYSAIWDGKNNQGRNVASGTYLVRLKAGDKTVIRKIALLR